MSARHSFQRVDMTTGVNTMRFIRVGRRFVHSRFYPVHHHLARLCVIAVFAACLSQLIAAWHPLDRTIWTYWPNNPSAAKYEHAALAAGLRGDARYSEIEYRYDDSPFARFNEWSVYYGTYWMPAHSVSSIDAGFPFRSASFAQMKTNLLPASESFFGTCYRPWVENSLCAQEGAVFMDRSMLTTLEDSIPFRPIWTGVIGNAIVYTLIVELLCFAVLDARRALRERQGRCGRCGQPRQCIGPCFECGIVPERPIVPDLAPSMPLIL